MNFTPYNSSPTQIPLLNPSISISQDPSQIDLQLASSIFSLLANTSLSPLLKLDSLLSSLGFSHDISNSTL